jgi:hypothetical protein
MRSCCSLVFATFQGPPSKHVDVVDLIIEQMLRMAFPNKSLTFAQQLLKTLRHDRGKAPIKAPPSDVGQDAAAGGDQGRQLQVMGGRHGRMPLTSGAILVMMGLNRVESWSLSLGGGWER